jgi:hypothetical protein
MRRPSRRRRPRGSHASEGGPVAVEEVEQREPVVGDEHHLGRAPLAVQRELDDIAIAHGGLRLGHGSILPDVGFVAVQQMPLGAAFRV